MPTRASIDTARSIVSAVRIHFGISQTTLAAYLGVSRSLVSMDDLNQRQLPTAALLRLLPLGRTLPPPWSQGLPDPPPPPDPVLPLPAPLPHYAAPAPLRRRLLACEGELNRATRTLALAERPAAQARRLLAVLPALRAALPPTDARALRQIPFLEAEARDHLGPEPTAARALLAARQQGLRAEAAWLRAWLTVSEAQTP